MKQKHPLALALLAAMALFFYTCKEDLSVDNSDKNFPIELRVETVSGGLKFSWDAANVSKFEEYVLVRSTVQIPVGLIPAFSSSSFQILQRTDKVTETEFVDEQSILAQDLFYKLYVKINGRFLESAPYTLSLSNLLLPNTPQIIEFFPDSNWLIVSSQFDATLQLIDYEKRKILNTRTSVPTTNQENMGVDIGYNNGVPELYWWASWSSLTRYSLPGLTPLESFPSNLSGFSLISTNDGVYVQTQYDYDNALAIRSKANYAMLKGHYRSNYYDRRTLLMLDPATNKILEVSPFVLRVFNISSASGTISNPISLTTNTYNTFVNTIPATKDRAFFIPQLDGVVYNQDLKKVGQIPPPQNGNTSYIDFAFSPDGNFVYSMSNDQLQFGAVVEKFSFPNMELLASKRITGASGIKIEGVNGGVVFIGANVNGTSQSIVSKITI